MDDATSSPCSIFFGSLGLGRPPPLSESLEQDILNNTQKTRLSMFLTEAKKPPRHKPELRGTPPLLARFSAHCSQPAQTVTSL